MVSKKGYLRTIEALISVIALLAVMLIIIPREAPEKQTPEIITTSHNYFLETLINSPSHRDCILKTSFNKNCNGVLCVECKDVDCLVNTNNLIDNLLTTAEAPGFTTKCIICKTNPNDRSCLLPQDVTLPDTDIYVDSTLITNGNDERLVRLFSYAG